jgi:hypothetical protein
METSNPKTLNLKTTVAGLALAGLLPLAANADGGRPMRDRGARVSGEVSVTHQIPGGVITVGAEWGRRPQPQPQVVVVQDRRPDVVVIDKGHGRDWEHAHKRNREVTIVREAPRRKVVVVEHRPAAREKVVVVENKSCDRPAAAVTHEYRDGRQVSIDRRGPNGTYHYYEDAHQVSIDDNRDGNMRHVYVRK